MTGERERNERLRLATWMAENSKGMWPDLQNNKDCRRIAFLLRQPSSAPRHSKREKRIVLPRRMDKWDREGGTPRGFIDGWEACLDETVKLNPSLRKARRPK